MLCGLACAGGTHSARSGTGVAMSEHLAVDPIACDGTGLCAELLPELITLDDWGFPIIDPRPISPQLRPAVQRAMDMCPRLALLLKRD
jgi:ferredoxin